MVDPKYADYPFLHRCWGHKTSLYQTEDGNGCRVARQPYHLWCEWETINTAIAGFKVTFDMTDLRDIHVFVDIQVIGNHEEGMLGLGSKQVA